MRTACCALLVALVGIAAGFPTPPPIPAPHAFAETMYGTSISDPYRFFENMDDPVVQKFFRDQNAYTQAVLNRLDGARAQLFRRIAQLDNAGVSVTSVTRVGPYYFYEKLKPGENSFKLYVRNVDGSSAERVLVNPQTLAKAGQHYTINYYLPSLDGSKGGVRRLRRRIRG